jgi:hypothetical protein
MYIAAREYAELPCLCLQPDVREKRKAAAFINQVYTNVYKRIHMIYIVYHCT